MPDATCRQCGIPLQPATRGRPPAFCSTLCRSRWHNLRKPSRALVGRRPCAFCGWTYTATNAGHRFCSPECSKAAGGLERGRRFSCDRFTVILWAKCESCRRWWPSTFAQAKFCSDSCKQRRKRRLARERSGLPEVDGPSSKLNWAECACCGSWFVKRRQATYCGDQCRREVNRRRSKASYVSVTEINPVVEHECRECGARFTTRRYSAVRLYCSKACRARASHRKRRHLERAAMREGEMFTLREIAERDGWTCHICGKKIPDRPSGLRDEDASIDHLIPLTSGGSHTRANVALAHRICNSRRGATGAAQLRLIA